MIFHSYVSLPEGKNGFVVTDYVICMDDMGT